ncbi:MAG: hypothetical protein V4450_09285 [Bacteroidota bacterium]
MTNKQHWLMGAGIAFVAVAFISWKKSENNQLPVKPYTVNYQDTVTSRKKSSDKKEYRVGDLDGAMKDLDRAMVDMDKNMKIDFVKMDKEIKAAMEELKKVNFEKIGHEVEASLNNVDWVSIKKEIANALRQVDLNMKEIDKQQIKEQMAKVKEQMEEAKINSKIDMKKMKESIEKGLASAKIGIENAKKEISLLKEFTNELDKDGLIDKKKSFKIEIKKGEMYINGTKQSKEVNDKYRKYFKDEDYTISSDKDGSEKV